MLSSHGLDEDTWQALDGEWQDRMSAALDGAGDGLPPLVREYEEAFRAAQAKEPVVSFEVFLAATRAVRNGGDVTAALARLGVTVDELVRANTHWAREMIADPTLSERFAKGR